MSEFKTMTKMKTDEPSVLTKAKRNVSTTKMASTNLTTGYQMYKDGGKVMKAEGGAMGALSDMAAMKMADKRKSKKAPMAGGMMDTKVHKHETTLHPGKPLTKLKAGGKAAYKDGGEVVKKAMGGRMGQKPAQTIRTAPIGGSQATRDLFASKGKTPAYKDGGNVEKMPEGKKAPSAPVRINQLAGTFKNGGKAGC